MRKTCEKPVKIVWRHCGLEHIMCTTTATAQHPMGMIPPVLAQQANSLYTAFPHPSDRILSLLQNNFSPLSTSPITTTTIYIN